MRFRISEALYGAVLALLVTPLAWWWCVARQGKGNAARGAVAGALIVPAVWILALVVFHVDSEANRPSDWHPTREWAKFGSELELMLGLVGSVGGAVVGAAYGAIVARLERLWSGHPQRAETPESH